MKLKECYQKMNGDYDDIMARLPREASIIKYLRKFAENQEFQDMLCAAVEKDYQKVFELSHDLKGMAANLSITTLQGYVSEICEQTRNKVPDSGFDELLQKAKEEYDIVIEAINQLED